MREVILDTETTGLDPDGGDRIVEIAAVEVINGSVTTNNFHVYVNPERDMPDSAFRVHGIAYEFLIDKPLFATVAEEFLKFIGNDHIVAHNAEFDLKFINSELARIGLPPVDSGRVIDTLALARRKHPGASNSLDALCARYGIDRSRRVKHGALIDFEILAEVYMELQGGRQTSLSFSIHKETRKLAPVRGLTRRTEPLGPFATGAELSEHGRFVEKLSGGSLWSSYRTAPQA